MSPKSQIEIGEWLDLPSEMLSKIAENLHEMSDHRRFRSISVACRDLPQIRLPMQIPWLHLPYPRSTESRYFYSFSEDRIYKLPLSDGLGSNLFGSSSNGNLLSIKGFRPNTSAMLLNPFTKTSRKLPPLDNNHAPIPHYSGAEYLVWDHVADSTVFLMRKGYRDLFYSRLGDHSWKNHRLNKGISNMACHNGNIYVVAERTCDTIILDGETLDVLFEIPSPVQGNYQITARLVKSSKGLFLILVADRSTPPQFWAVYRLSRNGDVLEWSEVADIGNHAIFIDLSHGFLVQVPENSRIKKSCVYYAQLNRPRLSIFNLENRRYEKLDGRLNGMLHETSHIFSPCWVVPN